MMLKNQKFSFKLENWIVDPAFNRLVRGDAVHRVEPKVMSVLLLLAAQAKRVVTKDEILHTVWPGTYVGEDALPRCISMLRHILGDDPHNPRFIQTVSKVGYCLLVEPLPLPKSAADEIADAGSDAMASSTADSSASLDASQNPSLIHPDAPVIPSPRPITKSLRLPVTVAIFLGAAAVGIWSVHALHPNRIRPTYQTFQVTTNAGEQSRPALAPDGKHVAYVWEKEDGSPQHIYIKELGRESVHALSPLPDLEYSPVWSPDGKQLAYLSSSSFGLGLYLSSLSPDSAPRKIYIPNETTGWDAGALSWSPDGKSFLLADHMGSQPSSSIIQIDIATLTAHALTTPPTGWEGDVSPAFSPDGQKIAFVRESESETSDLYWIPAAGGEPHQITRDGKLINGIAWSTDSQSIIFSSNRAGQPALWQVALNGGAPERLPIGTEDATQPAVSAEGDRLAFVQSSAIFGILRIAGLSHGSGTHDVESVLQTVISSTAEDSAPSVSPDGTQFAFQSWRSGTQQIWLSSLDGQSLRQFTPNDKHLYFFGSPAWAPSGWQLAFDCRRNGHSHIFVMAVSGGTPRQLTFGDVNDIVPRWSIDGKFLYFRSNRGGRWQLWKLPATGGAAQPVTREDGFVGQESPDGKWLYFARGGENGIWRMPIAGGEEVRILDQPAAGYWGYWAVSSAGIYFLDQSRSTSAPAISVYDPATQKITPFARLDRLPPLYSGISLIPGKRELLMDDKQDAGSHIAMTQGTF